MLFLGSPKIFFTDSWAAIAPQVDLFGLKPPYIYSKDEPGLELEFGDVFTRATSGNTTANDGEQQWSIIDFVSLVADPRRRAIALVVSWWDPSRNDLSSLAGGRRWIKPGGRTFCNRNFPGSQLGGRSRRELSFAKNQELRENTRLCRGRSRKQEPASERIAKEDLSARGFQSGRRDTGLSRLSFNFNSEFSPKETQTHGASSEVLLGYSGTRNIGIKYAKLMLVALDLGHMAHRMVEGYYLRAALLSAKPLSNWFPWTQITRGEPQTSGERIGSDLQSFARLPAASERINHFNIRAAKVSTSASMLPYGREANIPGSIV
jgi:hypothetical protein